MVLQNATGQSMPTLKHDPASSRRGVYIWTLHKDDYRSLAETLQARCIGSRVWFATSLSQFSKIYVTLQDISETHSLNIFCLPAGKYQPACRVFLPTNALFVIKGDRF